MQRSNPTSPHPMPPPGQAQLPPLHSPPTNERYSSAQQQPSLPPPAAHHDEQQQQGDTDQYQQVLEQVPPQSSQLIRYGDNLPSQYAHTPVDRGIVFERVISLPSPPPPPSSQALQPYQPNQARPQVYHQGQGPYHDNRPEAHRDQGQDQDQDQHQHQNKPQPGYEESRGEPRPQPTPQAQPQLQSPPQSQLQIQTQAQNQVQGQSPIEQPRQIRPHPPSVLSKPQTPRKNPFAAPPPSPSTLQPASSPIPQMTSDRPIDSTSRLLTDPGAANRTKQSISMEGITYQIPPPHNRQMLVKRSSKGVNGVFKVPWGAGSPQQIEAQRKSEEEDGKAEERVEVEAKPPARQVSLEEQQIHQMMSEKKEAARKRAQAVKESLQQTSSTEQVTQDRQSDPFIADHTTHPQGDTRAQLNNATSNADQNQTARSPAALQPGQDMRKGGGQVSDEGGQKVIPEKGPSGNSGKPYQGDNPTRSSREQSQGRQQPPPNQQQQHHQQQRRSQGGARQPNLEQPRQSNQPKLRPKVMDNDQSRFQPRNEIRRSPPVSMRNDRRQPRDTHHRDQYRHNDVLDNPQARVHAQGQDQDQNQYHNRDRSQQRSSPSPYHQQDSQTEYIGRRQDQAGVNQSHDDNEDMGDYGVQDGPDPSSRVDDHAYQQTSAPGGSRSNKRTRGRGDESSSKGVEPGSKRQKQNIDEDQSSFENEMEVEGAEQEDQEEDAPQFDAFAEIEKYDHVKELQEPWNEMMDEMVPFIDDWAEKYLSTALDTIYSMYGCFYNMSTKNAESLELGVEDILENQATQNEIRQTLVDFRAGVASISQRLVSTPGNSKSRSGTPAQGGSK